MPLAQAAPDPAFLASWISVLMYLIGCAAGLVGLLVGLKTLRRPAPAPMPQPLEVREHAAYATAGQVEMVKTELHGRIKRERIEINEQIARVEQAAAERSDKLDDKLDRNTELTAATRGEVKLMNQQLAQVLTKLLK